MTVKFPTDRAARLFVRRVTLFLSVPCLILGNTVHVVIEPKDFNNLATDVSRFGGTIEQTRS